jgi:hypothetical protein
MDGGQMLNRAVVLVGLLVLGAGLLLALAWLTPATRADLFDSPLPTPTFTPSAYLPFVAARAFVPPPPQVRIYLPVVVISHPAP